MMRAVLNSLTLITLGALSPTAAFAEGPSMPPLAGWELGAYFDIYDQSSAQAHPGTTARPHIVNGRLFDRNTSVMTVNMVELSARRKSGKTSLRIEAAFGDMVDVLAGSGTPSSTEPTRNIAQAFVAYEPIEPLTLTFGKFYAPIGFETAKAKDNWQYSRSYAFNYAVPLWHQGASAGYALVPSKLTGTLYAVNNVLGPISSSTGTTPAFGVVLTGTPLQRIAVNYSFMTSFEPSTSEGQRDLHDVNVTYQFSAEHAVALDYTTGSQRKPAGVAAGDTRWSGFAIYAKAGFGFYTLSPRYEVFDDSDSGYAIGAAPAKVRQKLTSLTVSNKFDLDPGLELRFEYRTDRSDSSQYFKNASGAAADQQDSFTLAVLYAI